MNQRNLVLKATFSFNAGQLLHVHLHAVSAYRQVIVGFFALFGGSQLLLLENLKHRAPVGKWVAIFKLLSDTNRAEYVQYGVQRPLLVESYLFTLLSEISHVLSPAFPGGFSLAITITNRFRELLYGKSGPKKSVSAYASELNITANHLNKVVKSVTGQSPIQWIDQMRVREAKVLLFQSSLSISEVSYQVGLADPSYFARLFKKYEGATPTAYRKALNLS